VKYKTRVARKSQYVRDISLSIWGRYNVNKEEAKIASNGGDFIPTHFWVAGNETLPPWDELKVTGKQQ
jgi:hypothetical protein